MSLAQYLALGKSVEHVSGNGRYKVAGTPPVPKFTAPRPAAKPRTAEVEIETLFDQSQPPAAGVEAREPLPLAQPQPLPGMPPAPAPQASPPANAQLGRVNRWFLGLRRGHQRQAHLAPEQRELALGLVRPVRNDLRETDLEVVPAARPPEPAADRTRWGERCRRLWRGLCRAFQRRHE